MNQPMPKEMGQSKLPPVTPAIRAKAEDNLRKAKVQLVLHQPFFASIVLKRKIEVRDDLDTSMVSAAGKITVGTHHLAKHTVAECVHILAHEAMHYAMLHHLRIGHRKIKDANRAMDQVINDILKASNVGSPPKEGYYREGAKDFAWEQIYEEMQKDEPPKGKGKGKGGGQGQGQPGDEEEDDPSGGYQPGSGTDDLSGDQISEVTPEDIENIKQELIQARQAAKSQGKMPAGMEALINEMVNPTTPWHTLLERYMTQFINAELSWRRIKKSRMSLGFLFPSAAKQPKMGLVVIQMDESGSISKKELEHFSGHINKIIETCCPERVIVLHTDTRVGKDEEFGPDDFPIQFKSYCGGGTDMSAGFRWVEEHGEEPDCFVTLTDGYTPWGEPQVYPTIWLITTKGIVAPHGESIEYEITD